MASKANKKVHNLLLWKRYYWLLAIKKAKRNGLAF